MDELIKTHLEDTHREIDDKLVAISTTILDHGRRLNSIEKEVNTMTTQLETLKEAQEKFHDKMDVAVEQISALRIELPNYFIQTTKENTANLEKSLASCRDLQNSHHDKEYIKLPEGFKGGLVKVMILVIAGLSGLEFGTGIITSLFGEEHKPKIEHSQPVNGTLQNPSIPASQITFTNTGIKISSETNHIK